MDKIQVGEAVFSQAKLWLRQNGYSLDKNSFPADFPVSRRTLYAIAKGQWTESILAKMPFRVTIIYSVSFGA
jgi:hypothetical protein